MDPFQAPTTRHFIQQQSQMARRYEIERRIDTLFKSIAVEIAHLFIDKEHEIDHAVLKPFYQELRQLQHEVQTLLRGEAPPPFQQYIQQSTILPLPETPDRLVYPRDNQTYSSTVSQRSPTLKIKVRVLDEQNKKPSESLQNKKSVYQTEELRASLTHKGLPLQEDPASINIVVSSDDDAMPLKKPQKLFS